MQKTAQKRATVFGLLLLINSIFSVELFSQNVAVTDDDTYIANSSAMLDVKSDSKGLLIPRLTTVQRGAINPVATGLLVFDTDYNSFFYYNGEEWLALPQVSTSTGASDALFAVKNSAGDTIFAVYNDGVKVVVPYGTKGKVGGFAVSGRSPTKAGEEEYLLVTPDSTRVFVNEVDVKGKVGGFAVSGRSPTKSVIKDYFVSTNDSTRIYVEESTKGSVGGFAVSGRSPTKGETNNYMEVTRDSTRIYVTEGLTKGKVGGFAVSGRSPTKASETNDYFNISGKSQAEIINNESRIMWYPVKAALLAGEVHVGTADSVGTNSTSLGYRTVAKGNYSQAMGYKAMSLGLNSTAIGNYAYANSNNSFAIGDSAIATGIGSYAIGSIGRDTLGISTGNPAKALGDYSFAMGLGTRADSTNAFAFGSNTRASGSSSLAFGFESFADGRYAIAGGYKSYAFERASIALGEKAYANKWSVALGVDVSAGGEKSIVIGSNSFTNGNNSIVIGSDHMISSNSSTAIGNTNDFGSTAVGSVAIGEGNISGMTFSYSFGQGNLFLSHNPVYTKSMALGFYNTTDNNGAFAIGHSLTSSGVNSFSIGTGIATSGNYSIGIALNNQYGTTVSQNNTMAIMGGNVGIGTVTPAYTLDVAGNIRATGVIYANANGQAYFKGGDDSELWDVNSPNTLAICGVWDSNIATLRLGSGAGGISEISGSGGNIGIGTISPAAKFEVIASGSKTAAYNGLSFSNTATSSTASITKTGLSITSTGTWNGISAVNRGLYVNVSGGTSNYAAVFTGGSVGFGTETPWTDFHVTGNAFFGTNLGINALQFGGGTKIFAIEVGTAPTTNVTNTILLYAEGVNGELKVRDELGNVTTLSPHNFDFIPKSEPMAWSFHSENTGMGQRIDVDMLRAIRIIENLSGEQLVRISEIEGNKKITQNLKTESLVEIVKKQQDIINKLLLRDVEYSKQIDELREQNKEIESLNAELEILKQMITKSRE